MAGGVVKVGIIDTSGCSGGVHRVVSWWWWFGRMDIVCAWVVLPYQRVCAVAADKLRRWLMHAIIMRLLHARAFPPPLPSFFTATA